MSATIPEPLVGYEDDEHHPPRRQVADTAAEALEVTYAIRMALARSGFVVSAPQPSGNVDGGWTIDVKSRHGSFNVEVV